MPAFDTRSKYIDCIRILTDKKKILREKRYLSKIKQKERTETNINKYSDERQVERISAPDG